MPKRTFKTIISLMSILIILANTIIPITFYPQTIFAQEPASSAPPPFPINLSLEAEEDLASRLPNSTWQALLPDDEELYRQWVDEEPEKLMPIEEGNELKTQSNKFPVTTFSLDITSTTIATQTIEFPKQGFSVQIPSTWLNKTGNSFGAHLPEDTVVLAQSSTSFDISIVSVKLYDGLEINIEDFSRTIFGLYRGVPVDTDLTTQRSNSQELDAIRTVVRESSTNGNEVISLSEFIMAENQGYWLSVSYYAQSGTALPLYVDDEYRLQVFEQVVKSFNILRGQGEPDVAIGNEEFQQVNEAIIRSHSPRKAEAAFVWPTTGYIYWIYQQNGHNGVDIWTSTSCNENSTSPGNAVYPIASGYNLYRYQIPGGVYDGVRIDYGEINGVHIWTHYWHLGSLNPQTSEQTSFIIVGDGNNVDTQTIIGYQGNLMRNGNGGGVQTTCVHLHITVANGNADSNHIDPSPYFDTELYYGRPGAVSPGTYVERTGDIGGAVKDINSQLVSGATVKFSGSGVNKTTTTDGSGLYLFSSVPAGPATITAVKNNAGGSTDVTVLANQSQSAPDITLDTCVQSGARDVLNVCAPPGGVDSATFIADVTLPDGSVVSPGQALVKTWRLQNTGSSTWGSGYQLVFVGGQQMGAPSEVNIPATSPGQEVDISVNLTAPSTAGDHTGFWQLRNPQGTYFGPQIYVQIKVQAQSSYPITLTADPTSPANTDSVQFYARVDNFPNFRAMRLKVDGNVVYEVGSPEFDYTWNTNAYGAGEHSIIVEVADQTDTSWAHPEIQGMTYTLEGTSNPNNHAPYAPNPSSPNDWHVYYSGNTAQLCAANNGDPDGDPITEYYFDIYDSAELWNSGWVGSNCVTTSALGPYGYQWRVKVRDGYGAESGWSDSWHFTLVNPVLSITDFYFEPQDADSEQVKIRACTSGQGSTMRVSVNDANDGSANGQWRIFYELGVPCFNEIDAPIWRTLPYEDGQHLIRVEAHGGDTGWDGAAVAEQIYTLPHRRPDGPILTAPRPLSGNWREPIYLDSRTVTFKWESRVNVDQYTLYVSDSPAPKDDPTPIFQQTFASSIIEHTVTFTQDHPTLYWQVETTNDKGSNASGDQLFGIDRTPPLCDIEPLPGITYENVFQVLWSSSDNNSGTRFIDVQYQDGDRGEWQDWLASLPVAQTFDLFNGQSGHAYRFRCRSTDHAGNIGQYSAPSSDIQVDPTARPIEPWWDSNYNQKRSITVLNNMTNMSLPVDYPVHVRFDNTTTPSSATIFNGSESPVKCDDLRVVYNNTTELTRYISTCTSDLIEIWFRNQESVAPATSNNTAYRLYYGYAGANNPPDNQTDVWYPLDDANTVGLWFLSEGTGTAISDHSGYGNNGIKRDLIWTDNIFGKALMSPNPGNSNGAFISGNASMGSPAFTLEFFAKRDDFAEGYIAGMGTSGNDRERMRLQVQGPGTIKFQVDPAPGGASDIWAHSGCLSDLEWQHIAVTFDGDRTGKIYCGGVLAGSGLFNDPGISNLNFDLYFGSDFSTARRFHGVIDQVRLSNIVRTSFPHAQFAEITLPPSVVTGDLMPAPTTGQPDLAIQTVRTYPSLAGGILIEAVVQNLGSENTQNGFYTDLYIDHLPTGASDYTNSLQFWVNDPIEAGTSVTLTTVITDWGTSSGLMFSNMAASSELSGTLYGQVDSSGVISETNNNNNIYSTGVEICLASSDAYENDETYSSASLISLDEVQTHNFDRLDDLDWLKFEAQGGITYTLQTSDLGLSADTYLYVYDTDGVTLLASNDDYEGSLASYIEWTAPTTGTYYALIRHWNPNVGGCSTSYNFSVAIYTQPESMVTITTNPNSVMIESGGYQAVDYTFSESGGTGVVITKREAWFELVDGSELLSDKIGPYGNNIEITPYGTTQWTDNVYLPPAVVENARAYNASTIALRTIYYGVDDYSREVSYVAVLHINIPFQVFLPIIIR